MNWTTILFLLIASVIVIYLIWQLIIFFSLRIRKQKKLILYYEQYLEAKTAFEKTEKVLLSQVESIFGAEVSNHLKNGTIWEKMPTYLLKIALGEPKEIQKSNSSDYWIYGPYKDKFDEEYYLKIAIEKQAVKYWEKNGLLKLQIDNNEVIH